MEDECLSVGFSFKFLAKTKQCQQKNWADIKSTGRKHLPLHKKTNKKPYNKPKQNAEFWAMPEEHKGHE